MNGFACEVIFQSFPELRTSKKGIKNFRGNVRSAATLDLLAGGICRLFHGIPQYVDGNWRLESFSNITKKGHALRVLPS